MLYWSNRAGIERLSLDGLSRTRVIESFAGRPNSMVVDVINNTFYWSDNFTIEKSDLNGRNREVIVPTDLTSLHIAVDPVEEKLYWTNTSAETIERANLDGTEKELLLDFGTLTLNGNCSRSHKGAIVLDRYKQGNH